MNFKKLGFIVVMSFMIFSISPDVYGYDPASNSTLEQNSYQEQNRKRPRANGAPIDGGILTILGAAGVGYYLIRKKKKNSLEN